MLGGDPDRHRVEPDHSSFQQRGQPGGRRRQAPYDYAYPAACTNGTASPNGDPGADNEVSVLAHEIEETTTDPMGNAWYDTRGYENADKCAWNFGATYGSGGGVANMNLGGKHFLVQQNWINAGTGGCRLAWP